MDLVHALYKRVTSILSKWNNFRRIVLVLVMEMGMYWTCLHWYNGNALKIGDGWKYGSNFYGISSYRIVNRRLRIGFEFFF